MGRKNKNVADYFPHYCTSGKTIFILEKRFGNDGYAVWFKTLELLGASENHFYDCRNEDEWEFLSAKMHIETDLCKQIFDLLAKLGAINQVLWQHKIIWSENFVANLDTLYSRRKNICMNFSELCTFFGINVDINAINVDINTQSKVEYSKEKESKDEKHLLAPEILQQSNLFRKPNIPDLPDVQMAFTQLGGTKEMAQTFYEKNEALGWFLSGGPITNFRNLVPSFIKNWKLYENKTNGKSNGQPAKVDYTKVNHDPNDKF